MSRRAQTSDALTPVAGHARELPRPTLPMRQRPPSAVMLSPPPRLPRAPGLRGRARLALVHKHSQEREHLEVTRGILSREHQTSWETAESVGVAALREHSRLGSGARVVACIAEFPSQRALRVGDGREVVGTTVRLRDSDGETIWTLGIIGDDLIGKLHALRRRGSIEFLGRSVLVPKLPGAVRWDFVFQVIDVQSTTSALDGMGATKKERRETEELLHELVRTGRSPLEYLQSELETGLGIIGLGEFPALRDSLRFTALQAVSGGQIGNAPGKAHALIIGPPGHGKKLIGLAARILNPHWQEAGR
jgi:hypothetical protein